MAKEIENKAEEIAPSEIVFDYSGQTYTLAYDRASAQKAEKTYDISLTGLQKMHMADIEGTFKGSFIKNHPSTPDSVKEEILDRLGDHSELFKNVMLMYTECFQSLFTEPEEGKAITWTAK